jgi:7,8-dihydro-6-hydroxymethylpterin dimethyltransferase
VLREDNTLIPTTHIDWARTAGEDASVKAMAYVRRHWRYAEPDSICDESSLIPDPESVFNRIQSHSLCISGMAFQDAWNIDLLRLHRCCIHVMTKDAKLIPFCSYYLTDSQGNRLWDRLST